MGGAVTGASAPIPVTLPGRPAVACRGPWLPVNRPSTLHSVVPDAPPPSLRARFGAFWARHRTLFWGLHSLWALGTGVAVILLARERYGFVPWVCLFLVLTWVSTLFFGRRVPAEEPPGGGRPGGTAGAGTGLREGAAEPAGADPQAAAGDGVGEAVGSASDDAPARTPSVPGFGEEATSYLLRTMYQETLFFLLPFYAYSTVLGSVNLAFPILLGGLAIFSCIDLVFDRWLRTSPIFGLLFFSVVAFAALNLLLPILTPLDTTLGTTVAAVAAVGSAIPLAFQGPGLGRGGRVRVAGLSVVLLAIPLALPQAIPPVPLRLQDAVFSSGIDRDTLVPADTLPGAVPPSALNGAVFILMEVFAPTILDTRVALEWTLDGAPIRTSREIEITAHDLGFRVWDAWRPEEGPLPPGDYRVTLRTDRGRMFGRASIRIGEAGAAGGG